MPLLNVKYNVSCINKVMRTCTGTKEQMDEACDFLRLADSFFFVSFSLNFWLTTEKISTIYSKISPVISEVMSR